MRQTKYIILLLAIIGISGCIEDYYPKNIFDHNESYVIFGKVTDASDYHMVQVSRASSLTLPKRNPVVSCVVIITDNNNNVFVSDSTTNDGRYFVNIDRNLVTLGKSFKVEVRTPDGVVIESAFDTLRPCPDLQDVYFERVDKPTADPNSTERGVQFKVDFEADEMFGKFFRWEIEETFEYRSTYPISFYYDGKVNEVFPEDYSLYYCWQTKTISEFFPLSTKHLTESRFDGFKLHFVNNRSQRLMYLYSILVHQSAIGEDHYNYLEQINLNSKNQEGLFGTQPISIEGNLHSTSHPERRIHGYFSVEGTKSRRFFFKNTMEVPFEITSNCTPVELLSGYRYFKPSDYPVYLIDESGVKKWVYDFCVDCRELGGTTTIPDYWPI